MLEVQCVSVFVSTGQVLSKEMGQRWYTILSGFCGSCTQFSSVQDCSPQRSFTCKRLPMRTESNTLLMKTFKRHKMSTTIIDVNSFYYAFVLLDTIVVLHSRVTIGRLSIERWRRYPLESQLLSASMNCWDNYSGAYSRRLSMGVSATSLALLFGQHTCTAQAFGGPSLKGKHKHRVLSHIWQSVLAVTSSLNKAWAVK